MKIKNALTIFMLVIGTCAFARPQSAIIRTNYDRNILPSAQFSSYAKKTVYAQQLDSNDVEPAIIELESRVKQEPYNYSLYANLIHLYMKTKQYNNAFDGLVLLNEVKAKGQIDTQTRNSISRIYTMYKRAKNRDSILNYDLALLGLILDDEQSLDYAVEGATTAYDLDKTKKLLEQIASSNQNPSKAIEICSKTLAINPNDTQIRKIKAKYHEKLNQKNDAIGEYSKVIEYDSYDDEARYDLFKLLAKNSGIKSDEMIKRLYGQNSDKERNYDKLTDLLLENGNFYDAKYYSSVFIKKYGQNPNGYIKMAEVYKREGKIRDAYDFLAAARDKAKDNESIKKYNVMLAKLADEPVKEAETLISKNMPDQALEVLNGANPEALPVILTMAKANYALKDRQKTFEFLNKAMSIYPENADVYSAFAQIYLKENDLETATNYINQALKFDKNNQKAIEIRKAINSVDANKFTEKILNAMEAQNYDEATNLINRAIAIDKYSPDLYYYQALVNIAQNNYRVAAASLQKCIELDKNYSDAYFYLGASYDGINDKESALVYYKKYIELVQTQNSNSPEKIEYAKTRISKLIQ